MTAIPRTKPKGRAPKLRFQPSVPLLTSAETGLPMVRPNQFILVARRDRSQVSTIKNDLAALAVLLGWAHHYGVDLDEAIDRGCATIASQVRK